jgi:predicted nucleic acid-binding Zn ribbon protein
MTDPPVTVCPTCGDDHVRKLISQTSFVLKGGGWYKDHYGLKGASGGESKAAESKSGESKGTEATGATSSESKPATTPSSSGGSEAKASPAPAPSTAGGAT